MALSKPSYVINNLVSAYFERLYTSPVKTKAFTSCVIATLGNALSQKISGSKYISEDSLIAFGLFGLLFGGPVPHYFYSYIGKVTRSPMLILLIERLIYMPSFQALALYMLARFEGKNHDVAMEQMKRLYWPVVKANLKYLTVLQYINVKYVPQMLRVLFVNLIGFFWTIYLAHQRSKHAKSSSSKA